MAPIYTQPAVLYTGGFMGCMGGGGGGGETPCMFPPTGYSLI